MQKKCFSSICVYAEEVLFSFHLSSSGHSHLGSFFTNEEREGSFCCCSHVCNAKERLLLLWILAPEGAALLVCFLSVKRKKAGSRCVWYTFQPCWWCHYARTVCWAQNDGPHCHIFMIFCHWIVNVCVVCLVAELPVFVLSAGLIAELPLSVLCAWLQNCHFCVLCAWLVAELSFLLLSACLVAESPFFVLCAWLVVESSIFVLCAWLVAELSVFVLSACTVAELPVFVSPAGEPVSKSFWKSWQRLDLWCHPHQGHHGSREHDAKPQRLWCSLDQVPHCSRQHARKSSALEQYWNVLLWQEEICGGECQFSKHRAFVI